MARRTIAVLGGTGRQGRGLALRLANAGYRTVIGSRDPDRAAATVREWGANYDRITTTSHGDAIATSEIIILALPFDSVASTLAQHAARFAPASCIVDVTVPVVFVSGNAALTDVPEGSATEHVRAHAPSHVGVAAAFKTIPAHALDDVAHPLDCDEFVCGDSPQSRATAIELIDAIAGLRAIDVGPLSRARSIEHLTLLAIGINRRHKIRDARFRIVGM
jgi:NADPH-dependent F420 reductase